MKSEDWRSLIYSVSSMIGVRDIESLGRTLADVLTNLLKVKMTLLVNGREGDSLIWYSCEGGLSPGQKEALATYLRELFVIVRETPPKLDWLSKIPAGAETDSEPVDFIGSHWSVEGKVGGFLVVLPSKGGIGEEERIVLLMLTEICGLIFEDIILRDRLEKLAREDPLTGLMNRRAFEKNFSIELSRAERYHLSLSLVMFDLDHFKNVNDRYGHAAGDKVLRRFAEIVRRYSRKVDVVCRLGGEEIVMAMPHTELRNGTFVAKRICEAFGREKFQTNGKTYSVTVSGGISDFLRGVSIYVIVSRADKALYRAKEGGRNRIEQYEPSMQNSK